MTFWGLTLQIISLALSLLVDTRCLLLSPPSLPHPSSKGDGSLRSDGADVGRGDRWKPQAAVSSGEEREAWGSWPILLRASDDIACVALAFAHVVTVMFHAVQVWISLCMYLK